jgi:hypothetical protein
MIFYECTQKEGRMNIFKRWLKEAIRQRIAYAFTSGFEMAHVPPRFDRRQPRGLHRAEVRAFWRGYASVVRDCRKPINVQQTLDQMEDIVNRYRADPSKKNDFADELRNIPLSNYMSSIDERQDEVYAAFEAAAGELGIRGEPDTEFGLAEIQAEKRRSRERQQWRDRVTA